MEKRGYEILTRKCLLVFKFFRFFFIEQPIKPGYRKYKGLFQFEARNPDEISFMLGDTIWVGKLIHIWIM